MHDYCSDTEVIMLSVKLSFLRNPQLSTHLTSSTHSHTNVLLFIRH